MKIYRLNLPAVICAALALFASPTYGQSTYYGNSLSDSYGGIDTDPPLVILGEYEPDSMGGPSATSSLSLPTGEITDVDFLTAAGQSYNFILYVLSAAGSPGTAEQTFQITASANVSGTAESDGLQTFTFTPSLQVNAGQLLAFDGIGPEYNSSDAPGSDATYEDSSNPGSFTATAPAGSTFTVGEDGDSSALYDYISDAFGNQGRTYAIGVDITQAVAPPCVPPPSGIANWWAGEDNAIDVEGGDNGTLEGGSGYTTGIDGQAFSFDGSTGFLATSLEQNNPQEFSLECWFNTWTTQGGVLIGFGDSQTGFENNYDRVIYMDDSGTLHFGVWNYGYYTADSSSISPLSYNDGTWHHVAATIDETYGLNLYVDGALVGSNPQGTIAQDYSGWWRIGQNRIDGWPYQSTSSYFNGAIDEVSIYDVALAPSDIQTIYNAGSGGKCNPGLPTLPPGATQFLVVMPGETFVSGSPKTGTPTPQTDGSVIPVTVYAVDADLNQVATASPTVSITAADPNAILPNPMSLTSDGTTTGTPTGSATVNVTFDTAGNWTVTASDNAGVLMTDIGAPVTINPGPPVYVFSVLPGLTPDPGTPFESGFPETQYAGVAFPVTFESVDANYNPVGIPGETLGISSSDPNAIFSQASPVAIGLNGMAQVWVTLFQIGTPAFYVSGFDELNEDFVPVAEPPNAITVTPATAALTFVGIPNATYVIQSASTVTGPWISLSGNLTADTNGKIQYTDTTYPQPATRFYRTQYISGP